MTLIPPSPELQIQIRRETNEDENTKDASLQVIKEWLAKEPHLPDTWDEHYLMNFLRGTKFSLEKCKRKLDGYFTMRAAAPEFFTNRDISRPELDRFRKLGCIASLPRLTPKGARVTIVCGKDKNISFVFQDGLKITLMMLDIMLGEKMGVTGAVYVMDVAKLTIAHLATLTVDMIKKYMFCLTESYPFKIKEIHVINAHSVIDLMIKLAKPFLKQKILDRIHIHSDGLDSLYEFIPKDMLPEDYGGSAGKMQDLTDAWWEKLEEYTPWFQEQENIKADESKRPGTTRTYDDLFGVDGSFKQLTID